MKSIADKLAKWLIIHGCESKAFGQYAYAIEILLSLCILIGYLMVIGAMLGRVWDAILWYVFFLPLRRAAGGIHAANRTRCFCISIAIPTAALLLAPYCDAVWVAHVSAAVGTVVTFRYAPVTCPNHPLDAARRADARVLSRRSVVVEAGLLVLLASLRLEFAAGALGLIAAAISILLGARIYEHEPSR